MIQRRTGAVDFGERPHDTYEHALVTVGRSIDFQGRMLLYEKWSEARIVPNTLELTVGTTPTGHGRITWAVDVECIPNIRPQT